MTNKQYDTSKFEEALKDLDRWVIVFKKGIEATDGTPSTIHIQDKVTNLTFIIKDSLMLSGDNDCGLPVDKAVILEFKKIIYFKDKERRIQEVLNSFD